MTILIEVRSRTHPTSRPRWPSRSEGHRAVVSISRRILPSLRTERGRPGHPKRIPRRCAPRNDKGDGHAFALARTLAPTSLRSYASPDSRGRLSPRGPIRCPRHCLPPLRKNRALRLRSGQAPMEHPSVVVMRAWRGQECPRYTSSRFLATLRLRSGQAPMGHPSVVVMRAWRGQECPRYTSSRFLATLRLRSGQAYEGARATRHCGAALRPTAGGGCRHASRG
jgi:hypothetical protein